MAVYKVIQDIEAEDKLLGPLTFKGLVYAGIAATLGFLNFKLLTAGAPVFIKLPIVVIFALPMALFAVLASPLGRDQPTEVWLLARLKFILQPRKRLWNQTGLSQLVTVTAPKREFKQLTKGFSQVEVQSRLKALATTLDSRGWVVKNVNVNLNSAPDYLASTESTSDRLVTASALTREVPEVDIRANDDILDENSNPTAQKFQTMMAEAEQKRREQLAKKLEEARQQTVAPVESKPAEAKPEPQPQLPPMTVDAPQPVPAPEPMAVMGTTIITPEQAVPLRQDEPEEVPLATDEQAFLERLHREQARIAAAASNPPSIVPIRGGKVINPSNSMTDIGRTGKLELAQSGNDFSVATIASLANRRNAQ